MSYQATRSKAADLYGAGVLYAITLLVACVIPFTNDMLLSNFRDVIVYSLLTIPLCLAAFMFKGHNARTILYCYVTAGIIEYVAFHWGADALNAGDIPNWVGINLRLLCFMPLVLLAFFRVPITMALARAAYRFQLTRRWAIRTIQATHVTRLDIYMMILTVLQLVILLPYSAYLYYWYFSTLGEWSSYADFVGILVANGGAMMSNLRYLLMDNAAMLYPVVLIVTAYREWYRPDMLSLNEQ